MSKAREKLSNLGLEIVFRHGEDASKIDFSIADEEDNVAWVWGDDLDAVSVECNHPDEAVEFGDDDELGVCTLCGATCGWVWQKDVVNEGHDEDGNYYAVEGDVRAITTWFCPAEPKGIIKQLIKEEYQND